MELVASDHSWPFQCRMVPALPTAHTSSAALPQTPLRFLGVLLLDFAHALPFQCRMAPPSPTAQTLSAALPHTALSAPVVPLATDVHVLPLPSTIVPSSPTAHRLFGSLPQTAFRLALVVCALANDRVVLSLRCTSEDAGWRLRVRGHRARPRGREEPQLRKRGRGRGIGDNLGFDRSEHGLSLSWTSQAEVARLRERSVKHAHRQEAHLGDTAESWRRFALEDTAPREVPLARGAGRPAPRRSSAGVRKYETRDDECGLARHARVFEAFQGRKTVVR